MSPNSKHNGVCPRKENEKTTQAVKATPHIN